MLFTGWEVRTGKIFCRGLKNGAEGRGTFLRPRIVIFVLVILLLLYLFWLHFILSHI